MLSKQIKNALNSQKAKAKLLVGSRHHACIESPGDLSARSGESYMLHVSSTRSQSKQERQMLFKYPLSMTQYDDVARCWILSLTRHCHHASDKYCPAERSSLSVLTARSIGSPIHGATVVQCSKFPAIWPGAVSASDVN